MDAFPSNEKPLHLLLDSYLKPLPIIPFPVFQTVDIRDRITYRSSGLLAVFVSKSKLMWLYS